jgi:hypothetical protein
MQIEHSALPSDPSISLSTFFVGNDLIADWDAGGGAVPALL